MNILKNLQINPAPKNPQPEGIAALTRLLSHPIVLDLKAKLLEIVKKHAPKLTKLMVLIPAGLSEERLSKPIAEPKATLTNILLQ